MQKAADKKSTYVEQEVVEQKQRSEGNPNCDRNSASSNKTVSRRSHLFVVDWQVNDTENVDK